MSGSMARHHAEVGVVVTYAAKVLADSIASDVRLTTLEVTFPRFILAEFNTHRMLSRNSASSRAIPVEKRIAQVRSNPFVPEAFGKNKSGMQASANLDDMSQGDARLEWIMARDAAVESAERLAKIGVHKQHANRLLEPFCWHTVVVTATEWANFFALRCHPAAQPEMQITAKLMRDAMEASTPTELEPGEWHLPYVDLHSGARVSAITHEWDRRVLLSQSVVRCAAVSYERQNVDRTSDQMIARRDDLAKSGHWSPFEHQAKVAEPKDLGPCDIFIGNFREPWVQYRKMFHGEAVFGGE